MGTGNGKSKLLRNTTKNIRSGEFNKWFYRVIDVDGRVDLDRMYEIARMFDIKQEYRRLDVRSQRINVGNLLRNKFRILGNS